MAREQVLSIQDIRKFVIPLLSKYGLRSARLFGSYARGEARPDSDIDLLIEGGDDFSPLSVYALAEDLREVSGKDVDAFEVGEVSQGPFLDEIAREAVAL